MRVFLLALMLLLAGCAGTPTEPAEPSEGESGGTSFEAGNETAVTNETLGTFTVLATTSEDPVEAGKNITIDLDADLTADVAGGANWTIEILGRTWNGSGLPASVEITPPTGQNVANITSRADGYTDANTTLVLPEVFLPVLDPASASRLIVDESFTGLLPVEGTVGTHTFEVPADGVYVVFTYTSSHIGLFSAVARLTDSAGQSVFYSLDDCGIALTPGVETESCTMEKPYVMPPGTWTATVSYQAGQVTEEYTLDIQGFAF